VHSMEQTGNKVFNCIYPMATDCSHTNFASDMPHAKTR
jgi:hypothetical protein